MKKSMLFLVLVLLVSAFMLTACNSAQDGSNTNAAVTGDENLTTEPNNVTIGGITTPDEPIGDENEPEATGTQEPGETTVTEPGETTATEPGETTATEPSATTPENKPIELPDVPF